MSVGYRHSSDSYTVGQKDNAVKLQDAGSGSTDNGNKTAACNEAPGEEREVVQANIPDDNDEPEVVTELYSQEYSIETRKDETFEITGLSTTKNPGHILVSDHENKCIKHVDDQFNIIYRYPVVFEPWDVCVVGDLFIVVTFPFVRLMQYLKFKHKSRIVPWFPIKSQNEYYGVCADRDRIIATCKYDDQTESRAPTVHVMDRDGNVELVIEKDGSGDNIFTDPNYISLDPSTQVIYVSDQGSKQIISLDISGIILSRFVATGFEPRGITVNDSNGNIFVSNQDSVILLNRNLTKLQTIACKGEKMRSVEALAYCSRTDRLVLSMGCSALLKVFIV